MGRLCGLCVVIALVIDDDCAATPTVGVSHLRYIREFAVQFHRHAPRLTGAIAMVFVLAGCAGGSPPAGGNQQAFRRAAFGSEVARITRAVTSPSFMDPQAASKPLLFVSDASTNAVYIYLQGAGNKLVGQVTNLNSPYIIATDRARNLYVANDGFQGVQIYAAPYTGSPTTLDGGTSTPGAVAIANDGTVGVATWCGSAVCDPYTGDILFYAKNSLEPCATVAPLPTVANMAWAAFDKHGNFFVSGFDKKRNIVFGEVAGGCKATKMLALKAKKSGYEDNFGGIHPNKDDQMAIINLRPHSGPPLINTYGNLSAGGLGKPTATTRLEGMMNTSSFLTDFAFQASGKNVWVADSQTGGTFEYAYPASGKPKAAVNAGTYDYVSGVAVTPPLVP
jgi:hypothetical protein